MHLRCAALQVAPADCSADLFAGQLPRPGLYYGNYGQIYGHRAREALNLVYLPLPDDLDWAPCAALLRLLAETLQRTQEELLAMSAQGPTRGPLLPPKGMTWWLVGIKATGDQHIPMGQVSWRVPVTVDARMPDEAGVVACWSGSGQLAMPGFRGPHWAGGVLSGPVRALLGWQAPAHVASPAWGRSRHGGPPLWALAAGWGVSGGAPGRPSLDAWT